MPTPAPSLIVLAGPNGAGKSTAAPALLQGALGVTDFVNADVIARGLSAFDPESAALAAGRIMLARLRELASQRKSFAFETTLASRTFAPWIAQLKQTGYRFHLVYIWLPNAQTAAGRVSTRVQLGGHHVPEDVIARRYNRGLENFFALYRPLATSWRFYDNSRITGPRLIAAGTSTRQTSVLHLDTWNSIRREFQK